MSPGSLRIDKNILLSNNLCTNADADALAGNIGTKVVSYRNFTKTNVGISLLSFLEPIIGKGHF